VRMVMIHMCMRVKRKVLVLYLHVLFSFSMFFFHIIHI